MDTDICMRKNVEIQFKASAGGKRLQAGLVGFVCLAEIISSGESWR